MPYTINKISYSLNLLKKKVLKKYSYGIAYNKVIYTKQNKIKKKKKDLVIMFLLNIII